MQLFYCPGITHARELDEQESFHAVKVLRLRSGDLIRLTDGAGKFFTGRITQADSRKTTFEVTKEEEIHRKKDFLIHVAIAPTKNNDRNEWFLEKAIEIGIDQVTFILCAHSERKQLNLERMQKIAISAMKQSLSPIIAQINPTISFAQLVKTATETQKFIAHLEEGKKMTLKKAAIPQSKYLVVIGPEGDFVPEEIELAIEHDFLAITLGASRLRTETAGLAACHILNLINETDE